MQHLFVQIWYVFLKVNKPDITRSILVKFNLLLVRTVPTLYITVIWHLFFICFLFGQVYSKIIQQQQMKSSKSWLPEEDSALIQLHISRGLQSWSKISKVLAQQFKILNKSPKNCRERYNNHLNPQIKREEWTQDEETLLINLQNELGNRWAEISRQIQGRTDNAVKNKFYSKYRKSLRNINHLLSHYRYIKIKEMKINFVYKIMNFLEKKDKLHSEQELELLKIAQFIKNEIITFENIDLNTMENQYYFKNKFQELMTSIRNFNINFKKKPAKKKIGRSSKQQQQYPSENQQPLPLQAQHLTKTEHTIDHHQQYIPTIQPFNAVPHLLNLKSAQKINENEFGEQLYNGGYGQQADNFWNIDNHECSYSF